MRTRLDDVRALGHDWVLLTDRSDVRWACGFSGSSGWLLVGISDAFLVTDARYTERATLETGGAIDVVTTTADADRWRTIARLNDSRTVAIRPSAVTVDDADKLKGAGVDVISADIGSLRRRKDDVEIETIRRAASIADRALSDVLPMIDVGVSELDVRDELEYRMRRLGADGPSYDTIVAGGSRNAAIPHHHPSAYRFVEGDPLVIDVGALVDGYHSDMTRTFVVGEPDDAFRRWFDAVAAAQLVGLGALRAGMECRAVDRSVREHLREEVRWFVHGTGHGVGLDIHEDPYVNGTSTAILSDGDVVTVEPGLYRVGLGGVRIEDLAVVRSNGADVLTTSPKDLLCLPSPPTT